MKRTLSNEMKTGVVVIGCLALLVYVMMRIGTISIGHAGYEVVAEFDYLGGVEAESSVRMGGVEIGKVKSIALDFSRVPPVIRVVLLLNEGVRLREDAKASVGVLGLMGEMYIEVTYGSPDRAFLAPGGVIAGERPFQMDQFMKKADLIADNLNQAITDVRGLTQNVDGVVTANKESINGIVGNLEQTAENFKEFSADIKQHPWKLLFKKDTTKKKRGER